MSFSQNKSGRNSSHSKHRNHPRTFVFDSAYVDLPYDEVENAFFSSDSSDSTLTSDSSTSSSSSSSSSSDDSIASGLTSLSRRAHRIRRRRRTDSNGNNKGNKSTHTEKTSSKNDGDVQNTPSRPYHRKFTGASSTSNVDSDSANDYYDASFGASSHSLKNFSTEIPGSLPCDSQLSSTAFNRNSILPTINTKSNTASSSNYNGGNRRDSVNSVQSDKSKTSVKSYQSSSGSSDRSLRGALIKMKHIIQSSNKKHGYDDDSEKEENFYNSDHEYDDNGKPQVSDKGKGKKTVVDKFKRDYDKHRKSNSMSTIDGSLDEDDSVEAVIRVGSDAEMPQGIILNTSSPKNASHSSQPFKLDDPAQNYDSNPENFEHSDHEMRVKIEEDGVSVSLTDSEVENSPQHADTISSSKDNKNSDRTRQLHSEQKKRAARRKRRNRKHKSHRQYSINTTSAAVARKRAGWDPGIDIRTTDVMLQSIGSVVTIVDYDAARYRVVQIEVYPENNAEEADEEEDDEGEKRKVLNREDEIKKKNRSDFFFHLDNKPAWSKVRWISVNGLSWEAISAISQRFDLHRLAIEDMVDIPQRTKADMYLSHTFCVLPMHKLVSIKSDSNSQSDDHSPSTLSSIKSNVSEKFHNLKSDDYSSSGNAPTHKSSSTRRRANSTGSLNSMSSTSSNTYGKSIASKLAAQTDKTIYDWKDKHSSSSKYLNSPEFMIDKRPLTEYKRAVGVEQVSLFLTNQNTVISFFERSAADIERPLLSRIATKSTMLRASCDPSMLLQAIMDIIVDQIQPIITAYRRRFMELEVNAMLSPSMAHTQDLHVMAAELSLIKSTIAPISSLVQSLRDHIPAARLPGTNPHLTFDTTGPAPSDLELVPIESRASIMNNQHDHTVIGKLKTMVPFGQLHDTKPKIGSYRLTNTNNKKVPVRNFSAALNHKEINEGGTAISPLAKLYMNDVADHLFSYTQDLDMMYENTQNIIDMIFNTIFYQSSESINQLSYVNVVFMPLTFWASYFGMNFEGFTELEEGTNFFWKVGILFTLGVTIFVMIIPLRSAYVKYSNTFKRKWEKRKHKREKQMLKKFKKRDTQDSKSD